MAGATLLFPGTLYNYGSPPPGDRREYADATGVAQGTVARGDRRSHGGSGRPRRAHHHCAARDFFGGGHGSWLDLVLAKEVRRAGITYPGPLEVARMGLSARSGTTLVRVAAIRLNTRELRGFRLAGHAGDRARPVGAIARATRARLEIKRMAWVAHPGYGRSCRSAAFSQKSPISGEPHRHRRPSSRPQSAELRIPRLTLLSHAPYRTSAHPRTHQPP